VPPVLPTESKPQYGHKTAALREFNPVYVCSGSWLCENAVARRADRIDLPSDRD
jgi:hypothetical protein